MKTLALIFLFVLLLPAAINADVVLPDVLSSGMVLQREQKVPIWGKADPGETVTVKFGSQTKHTTADKDGKWIVHLSSLKASSTPSKLTIEGKNKLELNDVLVGEGGPEVLTHFPRDLIEIT